MENITDELLLSVLEWVPPKDLIQSTVRVNKRFAYLIRHDDFWRCHPLSVSNLSLTRHQHQRLCLYRACLTTTELSSPASAQIPECLEPGTVLVARSEAERLRQRGFRVCAASTTHHLRETVENVLFDGDAEINITDEDYRTGRNFWLVSRGLLRWWSSQPSISQDSNEVLLFTTRYPLALISEVKVKPLRDPYLLQPGVFYTWKKTVIQAYRLPLESFVVPDDLPTHSGCLCIDPTLPQLQPLSPDRALINCLVAGRVPVYESNEHDIPPDSNEMMSFVLPFGVVANVVTITFIGKNYEQQDDMGYFACVERVNCLGIPLYAHPGQAVADVSAARA